MDDANMQAERELLVDVQAMACIVVEALQADDSAAAWKARREEIAKLRERIRTMRDRHLGRPGGRRV
jgi:hypothetical protein